MKDKEELKYESERITDYLQDAIYCLNILKSDKLNKDMKKQFQYDLNFDMYLASEMIKQNERLSYEKN